MKKILFFVMALVMSAGMQAQDNTGSNRDEKAPTAPSQAAQTFSLATQTAKYGYANQSALSLIQAASLLASIPTEELQVQYQESESAKTTKEEHVSLDKDQLLADATEMAAGDKTLLAMIENVKKSASRAVVGGARSGTHIVNGHGWVTFTYSFYGGVTASAIACGDGDTDLDMYVYDQNGNLICSDTDYSDNMVCVWTPRWTGPFTIKIVNRGSVYNRFRIMLN